MKFARKTLVAVLSVLTACTLFAGVFSLNHEKVSASESDSSKIVYKLSEELSKVGYTNEELVASGWNGTSRDANKQALLKTAYDKSAIEVYSAYAVSSPAYNSKYYYDWADDGNSWRFSYTAVAGLSSGNNGTTQERIDADNHHIIYSGTHGLVWGLALVAPEKGTITIPEHTIKVENAYDGAQVLGMGFSKSSSRHATLNPSNADLNMQSYEPNKAHTIPAQVFDVEAGERVYIVLFADTQGDLVSDSRVAITWDPSFEFEKYVAPIDQESYTLCEEIGKIALTEEELAATGWDGVTARTAQKEAALKLAFEKSAIKFYTASGYGSQNYAQKEYYKWSNTSNDWLFSYTKVNELGAGNAVPNSQNPRFTSTRTHMLYSRSADYHIVWAIGYKAPQDGVVTIPAHDLILNYFTNTDGLYIGFSVGSENRASINPNDASLNFVKYTTTGTSAAPENKVISFNDQQFAVKKGEVVYINIYCNPTGSDARASVDWNPTFNFNAKEEIVEPGVTKYKLSDEVGKIAYTDEELAASGWNGTSRDANKQALYGVAFAKSAFDFYHGAHTGGAGTYYQTLEYYQWMTHTNSWKLSDTSINGLCSGNNYYPSTPSVFTATGDQYVRQSTADEYGQYYMIAWTAPEKGTLTIPEHALTIQSFVNSGTLKMNVSVNSHIKPYQEGWTEYTEVKSYTIAERVINVNKGDVVYISFTNGGTESKRGAKFYYDPTLIFKLDECILNGHTFADATCTAAKTCSVCGTTEGEALGHDVVVDKAVASTCTATGLTEGSHCGRCGEVLVAQQVVEKAPHQGEIIEEGYDPTCTEVGYTDRVQCTVCGETSGREEIPALGHDWADATCLLAKTCTVCGETEGEALGHDVVVDSAVAPTCTQTGLTEGSHCGRCNEVLVAQNTVDALGHETVVDSAVAPTCTQTGLTEGSHCGRCGEVLVAQNTVDALGHDWNAATCTTPKTCATCGETEGEALGHDWAEATCTLAKTCRTCGETDGEALGHNVIVDSAVAPTCTQTGLTEGSHCGRCGEVLVAQNTVDALGHDWAEATCTTPKTCATCGETEGSALGHSWGAPTCEQPSTCATCGETRGEALGHDWVEATCTAPKTCATCGETEGEALGHDWAEATCTAPKTCATCGETEGEALGHDLPEVGCLESATCATCGHVEEARGHAFGEWEIVKEVAFQEDGLKTRKCATCGHVEEEVIKYDETAEMISCNGSLGSIELGMLLMAVSGVIIARKKRR